MTSAARRPRWKQKRWIIAATLWLLLPIAYPLSLGPAAYGVARGWLPGDPCRVAFHPLSLVAKAVPQIRIPLDGYFNWASRLGRQHRQHAASGR